LGYILSGLLNEPEYNIPVILSLRVYLKYRIWIPSKIMKIAWIAIKPFLRR